MKKNIEIEDSAWQGIQVIAIVKGKRPNDIINEALVQYLKTQEDTKLNLTINTVKETGKNVLCYLVEMEVHTILEKLMDAQKRNAPKTYLWSLKDDLILTVRKYPYVSEKTAEEIKQAINVVT